MIRQFELVDMVKAYEPDIDEMRLNRAYVFSMKAHGLQNVPVATLAFPIRLKWRVF